MKKLSDKYIGKLGKYDVYRYSYGGGYYATDTETGTFKLSGDTYTEVFDELAYCILEDMVNHI